MKLQINSFLQDKKNFQLIASCCLALVVGFAMASLVFVPHVNKLRKDINKSAVLASHQNSEIKILSSRIHAMEKEHELNTKKSEIKYEDLIDAIKEETYNDAKVDVVEKLYSDVYEKGYQDAIWDVYFKKARYVIQENDNGKTHPHLWKKTEILDEHREEIDQYLLSLD